MRNICRSFCTTTAGTSAVEFALLAPIFLLMIMGMVAYGIYFGASHSIQQIAADAARTAIAGIGEAERRDLALGFVSRHAGGYPFVDPAHLTLAVSDDPDDGDQFVVLLAYDARNLPIWNLLGGVALPQVTIVRRSTIRLGGL